MGRINKISRKKRSSKKQRSRYSNQSIIKSKRRQYIKKGGGINKYQKIIDTSEFITNMISDLKNEQEFTDIDLVKLVEENILPDSNEESIKRYLEIIKYFLEKKRDPLTIKLKRKYRPFDAAFLKNGKEIILAFDSLKKIQKWNIKNGELIKEIEFEFNFNFDLDLTPDNMFLAACSRPNILRIINLLEEKEHYSIEHDDTVLSIKISSNGKFIVSGGMDSKLRLIDLSSGSILNTIEDKHKGTIYCVDISPDNKRIVTSCGDNKVRVFNVDTLEITHIIEYDKLVKKVYFSPDSKHIGIITGNNNLLIIKLENLSKSKEMLRIQHKNIIKSISFSTDGKVIATGSGNVLKIFDTTSGEQLFEIVQKGTIRKVIFSPDSSYIVCIFDNNIAVYSIFNIFNIPDTYNKDIESVIKIVDYLGGLGELYNNLKIKYNQ